MRYICTDSDCDWVGYEDQRIRFVNSFGREIFKCPQCRGHLECEDKMDVSKIAAQADLILEKEHSDAVVLCATALEEWEHLIESSRKILMIAAELKKTSQYSVVGFGVERAIHKHKLDLMVRHKEELEKFAPKAR